MLRNRQFNHWTPEDRQLYRSRVWQHCTVILLLLLGATGYLAWRLEMTLVAEAGSAGKPVTWTLWLQASSIAFSLSISVLALAVGAILVTSCRPSQMMRRSKCDIFLCPCDFKREDLAMLRLVIVVLAAGLALLCLLVALVPIS